MDGPTGPVEGCIIARENHTLEGVYEDKWFCPGYGEFFSGVGDSFEGMAVAVPVDAAPDGVPAELTTIYDGVIGDRRRRGALATGRRRRRLRRR